MGRNTHVTFTGCTAHILDLLLEDIGKLDWVKPVINDARAAVKLIKGATKPRELYRELGGMALLLPGNLQEAQTMNRVLHADAC